MSKKYDNMGLSCKLNEQIGLYAATTITSMPIYFKQGIMSTILHFGYHISKYLYI